MVAETFHVWGSKPFTSRIIVLSVPLSTHLHTVASFNVNASILLTTPPPQHVFMAGVLEPFCRTYSFDTLMKPAGPFRKIYLNAYNKIHK